MNNPLPPLVHHTAGRSQKTLLGPQNPLGVRLRQLTWMLSISIATGNLGSEGGAVGVEGEWWVALDAVSGSVAEASGPLSAAVKKALASSSKAAET